MGTLELQVDGNVVFAHYMPPEAGPNNGGYLSRIFPGGSFKGISHNQLIALGTGSHYLLADERAGGLKGEEPSGQTVEDLVVSGLRWVLFNYNVGVCTESEVLFALLLAMKPGCITRVIEILPEEWRSRLAAFAADIPAYRERGGGRSFAGGQVTQIPDENLVAVLQWFESGQPSAGGHTTAEIIVL
ncbi:hypothetical protein [Zavarzinella formosa]|uniref:hypothetical protein n=1 Tax=Zavarzinella formosa TaxID=360055 RepID=UPI00030DEC5B|nr:hypothetical protein [Zavarzinella formosa]